MTPVTARRAGFLRDVMSLGGRALRSIPRDVETLVPALIIPVFFFIINVGALQDLTEIPGGAAAAGFDYKAFQIPVAILFAVTGLSRANILVLDIQNGYFDRLALSPVNRLAMLLGFMVADMALAVAMSVPVFVLAFAIGVDFVTGLLGIAALLVLTVIWAIVYNGFPYAIALKTGNPGGGELQLHHLLPRGVPEPGVRSAGGDDRLDGDHRPVQPGDVPATGDALAHQRGLGARGHLRRVARHRGHRGGYDTAGDAGVAGARPEVVGAWGGGRETPPYPRPTVRSPVLSRHVGTLA